MARRSRATYSSVSVDPDEEVMVGKGLKVLRTTLSYEVCLDRRVSPGSLVAEHDRVVMLDVVAC